MRVILFIILLIAFGFFAWKAAERLEIIEPSSTDAEETTTPPDEVDAAPSVSLPAFDIVRVDRTGYAVIAGRAAPGAKITVLANDEPLVSEIADANGDWAVVTETPLEAGPVELALEMTTTEGLTVRSDETIVIYVPERPGDRPLVLRTTPGGSTQVLQTPRDADGTLGPLALDAIDYDDSGAVIFSGRAEPQRVVEVYANRQLVGRANSDAGGRWTLSASMAPGIYTLQIIQLDEEGKPAYAIELPFERATADQVDLRDGRVVVQPGNSLWRISRRAYGRGAQYTIIYEANAEQIRDPDLIYPGQIFVVPESDDEDGQ